MHGQGKRSIFILGGSGGIGAAVAETLAGPGIEMLIHGGHDTQKLDSVVERVRRLGSSAQGLLGEIKNVHEFVNTISADFFPDVFVCAYGPLVQKTLENSAPVDWETMISHNLTLPGLLISRFGPAMAQRGFGRIILFGGTGTDQIRGFREIAAYSAAKTGLGVVAKSAAKAWGRLNVSCNVICPGYVDTEYVDRKTRDLAQRRMPGGRLLNVLEIAQVVKNLVDDVSAIQNGAIISCDSGM